MTVDKGFKDRLRQAAREAGMNQTKLASFADVNQTKMAFVPP